MSFWGCVLKPGESKKVETRAGELLHLSQACLAPDTPKDSSAKVMVEQAGQSFAVACLREGGTEFCGLDLFLDSSDAKFVSKGKATVHLTGYFEADEADDDSDEDMEDEKAAGKPAKKAEASPKKAAAQSPKVAAQSPKAAAVAAPAAAKKAEAEESDDEEEE